MFSQTALKIYALKKERIVKSNAHFWREFNDIDKIDAIEIDVHKFNKELTNNGVSLVCAFDKKFPQLSANIKLSEKPFLFVYKGDSSLLANTDNNVTVVGVLTPSAEIVERERKIVECLVQKNFCIISGLANGCDTIAHEQCLFQKGKTIAILPTTLDSIYPKKNAVLVEKIVQNGGLVITEYITEPNNRYESIKRFIERDRLQAMFASKIILIASYMQGQGDSGSRHAMAKAKEYCKERFVMYNEQADFDNPIFALNRSLITDGVKIITPKELEEY